MSIGQDIAQAVCAEICHLMGALTPSRSPLDASLEKEAMVHVRPFVANRRVAERIIRVEVDREREIDIEEWMYRRTMEWDQYHIHSDGPMLFMGVDIYVVNRLPAPGWRVVNPFREAK